MAYLDQLKEQTTYGDTGVAALNLDLGLLRSVIMVPKDFAGITEADAAGGLVAFLQGKAANDNPNLRWYPFPRFINLEDNSESAGNESFNYGISLMTTRGAPKFTVRYTEGAQTRHTTLSRAWHNSQASHRAYLVYDDVLVGREQRAADGTLIVMPVSLSQVFFNRTTPATSSSSAAYTLTIAFLSDKMFNEELGFVRLEEGVDLTSEVVGLSPVNLRATPGSATGHHILVSAFNGAADMHDTYATELAATAAWVLTNNVTGATITVSAVSSTATGWDLTTSAATNDKVRVSLAAPSVLSGLGVEGFASDYVVVTAP